MSREDCILVGRLTAGMAEAYGAHNHEQPTKTRFERIVDIAGEHMKARGYIDDESE